MAGKKRTQPFYSEEFSQFEGIQPPVPVSERDDLPDVVFAEPGADPLNRMHQAMASNLEAFMALSGVEGVGVGIRQREGRLVEDDFVISVLVDQKLPKDKIPPDQRVPESVELDGVVAGTDVIGLGGVIRKQQRFMCQVRGMQQAGVTATAETVVQGGIDIGPEGEASRGTLCNVFRNLFGSGEAWVTNTHVVMVPDTAFRTGQAIVNPSSTQTVVGSRIEIGEVDFFTPYVVPTILPIGGPSLITHLDAARGDMRIRVSQGNPTPLPRAERRNQCAAGTLSGVGYPVPGLPVFKSGQTTGVTHGNVLIGGAFISIGTIIAAGGFPLLSPIAALGGLVGGVSVCSLRTEEGDSGSAVVAENGHRFLGMHWGSIGGMSFYDDWWNIFLWMGVTL